MQAHHVVFQNNSRSKELFHSPALSKADDVKGGRLDTPVTLDEPAAAKESADVSEIAGDGDKPAVAAVVEKLRGE